MVTVTIFLCGVATVWYIFCTKPRTATPVGNASFFYLLQQSESLMACVNRLFLYFTIKRRSKIFDFCRANLLLKFKLADFVKLFIRRTQQKSPFKRL